MSVMFRRALEAHIQQLTSVLERPEGSDRKADISRIEALLASSTDGRFKRALNNAKKRMEAEVPQGDTTDLRRRLDALRGLFLLIKDHPDYAYRRKRSKSHEDRAFPAHRGRAAKQTA